MSNINYSCNLNLLFQFFCFNVLYTDKLTNNSLKSEDFLQHASIIELDFRCYLDVNYHGTFFIYINVDYVCLSQ